MNAIIHNQCQRAVTWIQKEWPLVVKASVIGALVHNAFGAYATAVYAATALILHHEHSYICLQISNIGYNDLIFSVITCVAPYFGVNGIYISGVAVIAHTISKNIQHLYVSGKYHKSLQELESVKEAQNELNQKYDQIYENYKKKESDLTKRLEETQAREQECKRLLGEITSFFQNTLESPQMTTIQETLVSNNAVWKVLESRGYQR